MKINKFIPVFAAALFIIFCPSQDKAQENILKYGAFSFSDSLTVPGSPNEIYDAMTGDISGWWDHSFSEHPKKFYIEPKPGGSFMEIFDDEGNGIQHAVVNYADRGKLLRFTGPLGLSGHAINFVTTYKYSPVGNDSTKLIVEVNVSGEFQNNWPSLVHSVWKHFIFERFKPYIESRQYKNK